MTIIPLKMSCNVVCLLISKGQNVENEP